MTDRVSFEAPPETVFSDLERRTIRGLAIPAGEVATSGGRQFRFARGSVEFGQHTPLLAYHDSSRPLGKLTHSEWTDKGLEVAFQLSKTDAADEALVLAADGVLGLSVGVDIPSDGATTKGDTTEVFQAAGREVSLTPVPAFSGARVTGVRLHDDDNEKEPAVADAPNEAVTPVATVNLSGLGEEIAAAFAKMPQAQPVPVAHVVREELPYRIGRTDGAHEFSADVFASVKGDGEAKGRIEKFLPAAFAVSTTSVDELNPTGNRPDMYVGQLDYSTPIWSTINKGSIADATPFTVPKFSSAATLVADHVEGTESSLGSFTTTSQTITPAPVSGKVEINREVIDQGGNPQVSGLIWREILRSYNEALEVKAVALLDGLTPTGITLTTAAADDALEGELTAALAALQYIRGGYRMKEFFVQVDLYKKLIAAVDGNGRKLFPVLGAQNATGTTSGDFADVMVGNLRARPAWALAATGTVAASSYLFSSDDVHGWASAPRRLDFDYQVKSIFMGVWGYAALANTRLAGVREIIYDPS